MDYKKQLFTAFIVFILFCVSVLNDYYINKSISNLINAIRVNQESVSKVVETEGVLIDSVELIFKYIDLKDN